MQNQITELITRRIDRLKDKVCSQAPTGGDTETCRQYLTGIQAAVADFHLLLDDLDKWTPEADS